MQLTISHTVEIPAATEGSLVTMHLLLTPQQDVTQEVLEWTMEGEVLKGVVMFNDAFGNKAHSASAVNMPGMDRTIRITGNIRTSDHDAIVGKPAGGPPPALFKRMTELTPSTQFTYGVSRNIRSDRRVRIESLHEINTRVYEHAHTTALENKRPPPIVDSVHNFLAICRTCDIPARFVSGYLAGEAQDQTHSWAEAYDDQLGWVGFDPSMGLCPNGNHVRIAVGLDAKSTEPIRIHPGEPAGENISVAVQINQ